MLLSLATRTTKKPALRSLTAGRHYIPSAANISTTTSLEEGESTRRRKLSTAPAARNHQVSDPRVAATTAAVVTVMSSTTDIEELHKWALSRGETTYKDPATGFTVFTELAHLQRGKCCGSQCRHCPYGWQNVQNQSRPSKVKSGDKLAIDQLLKAIKQQPAGAKPELNGKPTKKTGGRHGGRYTAKNVPYTRTGDKGTAVLLTGERRPKTDAAFEAMGTVDELCTVVGVAHAMLLQENNDATLQEWLLEIMSRLFDIGSHVANPPRRNADDSDDDDESELPINGVGGALDAAHVTQLEDWIDVMTEGLPQLGSFVLPTGTVAVAQLHVARTVCRRAERRVVELDSAVDPNAVKYLNRLSDFFFCAARWVNHQQGQAEIEYKRPFRGATQRNRHVRV